MTTISSKQDGMSTQRIMVQAEGLIVFISSIVLFAHLGGNGWLFAGLLLAPDLSALGFLVNKQVGTWSYNIAHFYGMPAGLMALGLAAGWELGVFLAIIWFAHIGMDRTVGYGLKYSTDFKDTHLQIL